MKTRTRTTMTINSIKLYILGGCAFPALLDFSDRQIILDEDYGIAVAVDDVPKYLCA
jgi:hypothetical protein